MFPRPLLISPLATVFSQRTLPSFRSRQKRCRSLLLSGEVRKIESPHTAGVAPLKLGRSAFHLIDAAVTSPNRPFSGEVPLNAGPRHCGQFSADATRVKASVARARRE